MIDYSRLSDGALADFYFSNLDFDPEMEAHDSQAIVTEVTRRGLTTEQLQTALNALGPENGLPELVIIQILEGANPITAIRACRGMTIATLAEAAGLDAALIEDVEAGVVVPSEDAVAAMAGALGVAPDDLVVPGDDSPEIGEDDIPW